MISGMLSVEILLLASLTSAYHYRHVPPAVEVPPAGGYQYQRYQRVTNQQPRRDENGRLYAYSYGTTAYHYNPQQALGSGYAAAHVTGEQAAGQSSAAGQRPECQNPMLRVFFKTCHPPGAAPPSPVQCQPIPGQTSFRCLIKQAAWPVVRISECPQGTASSSGDCIRLPGSFGTGAMIVPVAASQRVIQSSSVYRHCSNGACQTCIGEQCSTTGALTPMSVDHRFLTNSSTEVVAFGDAGQDVRQKCAGHVCKTCVGRICYDRSYPLLRVTAGCPPAVCEDNCSGFVYWTDQCPICRCQGFACREPCRTQSDCPAGSTCRNQVCVYAELPSNAHFDKVCTFSSQCPSDQLCYNWRCGARAALSRHLEQSCAVDHDCPAGYTCADMTCWEGDASRLRGQDCTLDHQCPAGYFCSNGKCTDVYHHGSFGSYVPSAPTIPPTTNRQCEHDQHCYGGETCFEKRCVTLDEYRRVDEARRRQQSQHQDWRPQHEQYRYATTTTTPAPQPEQYDEQRARVSADDEYQRRVEEYNRQLVEQDRQQEEDRRQLEEERRRAGEAAEAQRRRQAEEDALRERQQQEEARRRQEEEAERQRQEELQKQEEQRRLQQQEEEHQRRTHEQEEARRRAEAEHQNRLREQEAREQENRRRQEQQEQEASRRQENEDRRWYYPEPTPDVEVGEEATEDEPYDEEAEYERRMQEYNRQLKERQRQLHAENGEEPDQGPYQSNNRNPLLQYGQVEDHGDEDDFYTRTRLRSRPGENEDRSVSPYRIRYRRVRRRQ